MGLVGLVGLMGIVGLVVGCRLRVGACPTVLVLSGVNRLFRLFDWFRPRFGLISLGRGLLFNSCHRRGDQKKQ